MADTPRNQGSKPATASKARREHAKRSAPKRTPKWRTITQRPSTARGLLIGLLFTFLVGAIVSWTREQPRIATDQIMTTTRLVRTEFKIIDQAGTDSQRELARIRAPVGLDLGGRAPEEIALSILAEMLAVRYGRQGQPLSALGATGASIHAGS